MSGTGSCLVVVFLFSLCSLFLDSITWDERAQSMKPCSGGLARASPFS